MHRGRRPRASQALKAMRWVGRAPPGSRAKILQKSHAGCEAGGLGGTLRGGAGRGENRRAGVTAGSRAPGWQRHLESTLSEESTGWRGTTNTERTGKGALHSYCRRQLWGKTLRILPHFSPPRIRDSRLTFPPVEKEEGGVRGGHFGPPSRSAPWLDLSRRYSLELSASLLWEDPFGAP